MTSAADLAGTHAACFTGTRAWSEDEFASLLSRPSTALYGDAACFAVISQVLDEAEILTLATHPDRQRQGRARRLLADLDNNLRPDIRSIFLEVNANNQAAQALYLGCNYVLAGRRPNYYAQQDGSRTDALLLRKTLTE